MTRGAEIDAVRPVVELGHAGGHHVVEQTGEQRLELVGAPRHQDVDMPILRHRLTMGRPVGQPISVVDGDAVEEVGENPGRAQAGDAGADDDGMVSFRRSRQFAHDDPRTLLHPRVIGPTGDHSAANTHFTKH